MDHIFTIEQLRPIKDGMTISRDAKMGTTAGVAFFSLGKDTSISQECYDSTAVYIGAKGDATFLIGENMNNIIKSGEVMKLKDLISYEEGSIANLDVVSSNTMKFVLMAFDEGTGLTPHRAPGNAIVFALEGKATIGYEGKDYTLSAGENFRFDKNGLHSVTAEGKFKMALLLVLE